MLLQSLSQQMAQASALKKEALDQQVTDSQPQRSSWTLMPLTDPLLVPCWPFPGVLLMTPTIPK